MLIVKFCMLSLRQLILVSLHKTEIKNHREVPASKRDSQGGSEVSHKRS